MVKKKHIFHSGWHNLSDYAQARNFCVRQKIRFSVFWVQMFGAIHLARSQPKNLEKKYYVVSIM